MIRRLRRNLRQQLSAPNWLHPDFVRSSGLIERINRSRPNPSPVRFPMQSQQFLFDCLSTSFTMVFAVELKDYVLGALGIEPRHPFLDRGLAEFCLSILESVRVANNQTKHLLREAMKGVLPEQVRSRVGKPVFDSIWDPGARAGDRALAKELTAGLYLEREGVIVQGATKQLIDNLGEGGRPGQKAVRQVVSLEVWLALALEGQRS